MRLLTLLLILILPLAALCESAETAPATLPAATTEAEAEAFLLLPSADALPEVERGFIRYIGQTEGEDEAFRAEYWLGGEPGSELDLTRRERYGVPYAFHAGVLCSRAAYSMALSYLGIDLTPGGMSALMNSRNLREPYDGISALMGVERISWRDMPFDQMVQNYLTDPDYSPVYLYFRRPNGSSHAVLIIATMLEKRRYIVLDCNPPLLEGTRRRVYFISLNKRRGEILNSTFYESLAGSQVLQAYQWRLSGEPGQ